MYAFHLKLNCFEFANVKAGVYKKNGLHTSVDFMIYIQNMLRILPFYDYSRFNIQDFNTNNDVILINVEYQTNLRPTKDN